MPQAIYLFYFAAAGLVTFWPYHLGALGLSEAEIGAAFGVRTALTIGAQLTLAALGGRLRRPWAALVILLAWTFTLGIGMPWAPSGALLIALIWLQAPTASTAVPLLDALVVTEGDPRRYGRVRLWGSVGFGLSVGAFGVGADALGLDHAQAGDAAMAVYAALCGATVLAALPALRRPKAPPLPFTPPSLQALLRTPRLPTFLLGNALHWAAITIFNVFFPLHTLHLGHGNAVPGISVLAAVAAEGITLAFAARLLAWRDAARWLPWIAAASAARWLLTAWTTSAAALVGAQLLHAASFGLWLAASMELMGRLTTREGRSGLQALFFAAVFGGGGVLGTVGGGLLMERGDGPAAFTAAALLEGLALLAWLPSLRPRHATP